MAEIKAPEQTISPIEPSDSTAKSRFDAGSFSIWPPSQRTRDAVMKRVVETLSSDSILSKRYGVIPLEEASEAAKRIEEEAFGVAGGSTEEDGIEILQVYSKEISRRVLETVKSRSGSATAAATADAAETVQENSSSGGAEAEETAVALEKMSIEEGN